MGSAPSPRTPHPSGRDISLSNRKPPLRSGLSGTCRGKALKPESTGSLPSDLPIIRPPSPISSLSHSAAHPGVNPKALNRFWCHLASSFWAICKNSEVFSPSILASYFSLLQPPSAYLSVPVCLASYPPARLPVCLSACLPASLCLSICLPVSLSVCTSVYLPVSLKSFLSLCPCLCLSAY